jgi:hypothetical protein
MNANTAPHDTPAYVSKTETKAHVSSPSNAPPFDEQRTRKLLRKLDMRILPVLTLLYLLSFLDRTNIGNARLAGLEKDLNMKGLMYNVCYPPKLSSFTA